jgi:hypothetical protein
MEKYFYKFRFKNYIEEERKTLDEIIAIGEPEIQIFELQTGWTWLKDFISFQKK